MELIYFLANNPCEDPELLKIIYYIRYIISFAFTVIPMILIVMIIVDFIKSVSAGNEDVMKKNQKIIIKRMVYCILVFFVMPIVNATFSLFKTAGQDSLISQDGVNYLSCWANADNIASIALLTINASFNAGDDAVVYGGTSQSCGGNGECEILLPKATKKGFVLEGWTKNGSSDVLKPGEKVTVNENDTFVAVWKEREEVDDFVTNEDIINSDNTSKPKPEEEQENDGSSGTTDGGSGSSNVTLDSSGFYVYDFGGIKYYTIANAVDFQQHVKENEFYQDANSSWSDSCLGFSFVYADAIKNNNFNIINNQSGLYGGNDANTSSGFSEEENSNKGTILSMIYEEIQKHNPVVVQVNGSAEGDSRHYSVIIGIKQTIDTSNIQETDFLLLDVWDGNIEYMNGKGGENGVDEWKSRFMITGTATGRDYGYQIYLID